MFSRIVFPNTPPLLINTWHLCWTTPTIFTPTYLALKCRTFLRNKKALLENKITILGNKRALLENEMTILGIKAHFWEVKGHTDFRWRALATSSLYLEWSFLMFQAKIKISKIFLGVQICWLLNSEKFAPSSITNNLVYKVFSFWSYLWLTDFRFFVYF